VAHAVPSPLALAPPRAEVLTTFTSIITKAIEEGLAERKVDKESAIIEEKEGGKTSSRDEAEQLADGTKFKSSDDGGAAKKPAGSKPRRKTTNPTK
jgi:hypothetical protein